MNENKSPLEKTLENHKCEECKEKDICPLLEAKVVVDFARKHVGDMSKVNEVYEKTTKLSFIARQIVLDEMLWDFEQIESVLKE